MQQKSTNTYHLIWCRKAFSARLLPFINWYVSLTLWHYLLPKRNPPAKLFDTIYMSCVCNLLVDFRHSVKSISKRLILWLDLYLWSGFYFFFEKRGEKTTPDSFFFSFTSRQPPTLKLINMWSTCLCVKNGDITKTRATFSYSFFEQNNNKLISVMQKYQQELHDHIPPKNFKMGEFSSNRFTTSVTLF